MTTMTLNEPRPVQRVYVGDNVGYLYCSACHTQTEHVFGWYHGHPLTCLTCHPDAQQKIMEENHAR